MKVIVAGAGGLLGGALARALADDGHQVSRLVRHEPRTADEVPWRPDRNEFDPALLDGADAVAVLSGVGIGNRRWTAAYQRKIRASRIDPTTTIAAAMAHAERPPSVLLSASAVGWYGDTGESAVDESGPHGTGFLAETCLLWEAATAAAERTGSRVVHLRSGIVLAGAGGVLGRVLPLFRAGLGGRLGSGRQWMSWIALADHVAAMRHLLTAEGLRGPVNLTAPTPVRNVEFTRALGLAVHRPTVLPAPAFALRLALGGFAEEGVLVSQRVLPGVLEASGFRFRYPDIDGALQAAIGSG